MAYRVSKTSNEISSDIIEIVADARNEVETIPTTYGSGSTIFVIEDSSVWMLGNDKHWHEL